MYSEISKPQSFVDGESYYYYYYYEFFNTFLRNLIDFEI